jgi:membrane-anchored protein YejM (alkaline phosphatase superfamily)
VAVADSGQKQMGFTRLTPAPRKWHKPLGFATLVKNHISLSAASVLLTLLACSFFLLFAPIPSTAGAALFMGTLPFYHAMAILLVLLLLTPVALLPGGSKLLKFCVSLWLVYLVLDLVAYRTFSLHIDMAIIEVVLLDFRGVGATPTLVGSALLLILFALACILFVLNSLHKRFRTWPVSSVAILPATVVLFLCHAASSIWAFGYDRLEATRYSTYLPAYFPVTSSSNAPKLAMALPWLFVPEQGLDGAGEGNADTAYPVRFPQCEEGRAPKKSILLLVIESWRADGLTEKVMPFASRFAAGATRFQNHVSNGSATVPSLFTLLYGVNPSYFSSFRAAAASNTSVFTRTLAEQGYAINVFSSNELDRFSLRKLIFPMVPDENLLIRNSDEEVVADFSSSIAELGEAAPRFDFVMLTSSHFPYKYPNRYKVFEPVPSVEGQHLLTPSMDATSTLNDYYNSLRYMDALIEQVISTLEVAGKLEDTIVVITGDHAEEFNDNGIGHWGHGSNFTAAQTHTPLVVRVPEEMPPALVERTSAHVDVAPTLLRLIGCGVHRTDFSNGEDLFALPEKRALSLASYSFGAFWLDGTVFERSTGETYDWRDFSRAASDVDGALFRGVVQQERQFLER